jgi:hypothetical protein
MFTLLRMCHLGAVAAISIAAAAAAAADRNDTLAGRVGRRGDRVGGPYYMHRDDLSRLAPQWYNWTKIMRTDMEVMTVTNLL